MTNLHVKGSKGIYSFDSKTHLQSFNISEVGCVFLWMYFLFMCHYYYFFLPQKAIIQKDRRKKITDDLETKQIQ